MLYTLVPCEHCKACKRKDKHTRTLGFLMMNLSRNDTKEWSCIGSPSYTCSATSSYPMIEYARAHITSHLN